MDEGATTRAGVSTMLELVGHEIAVDVIAREEHLRYPLYVAALEIIAPDREREMLSIVLADPEPAMGLSAALRFLDRIGASRSASELAAWRRAHADLLDRDDFLARRGDEWCWFAEVREGRAVLTSELGEASDWLQRRMSEEVSSQEVLAVLETHGRTKQIRNVAARRRGS
jgi:hypothetical protein